MIPVCRSLLTATSSSEPLNDVSVAAKSLSQLIRPLASLKASISRHLVPAGQQVYVAASGALAYTIAHSKKPEPYDASATRPETTKSQLLQSQLRWSVYSIIAMAFNSTFVTITPRHLHNLLRLPPTLRCLLRPPAPIPTIRNLSTHSAKAPRPLRSLPLSLKPVPTLRNLSTRPPRTSKPPSSPPHTTTKPPPPPLPPSPSPTRRRFLHLFPRNLLWTFLSLLTYLPILAFTVNHIGRPMRVTGISMYPFLNTDSTPSSSFSSLAASEDRVWVSLRNPYGDLHRGDVVVFWSPGNPEHMAVKRVVGLEGDVVEMRDGMGIGRSGVAQEVRVPVGHIWVEGEHPEGARWSLDSNTYGPIPIALLVGKVKAVYWPWEKAGWVRWQDWKGSPRVREGRVEPIELYTF